MTVDSSPESITGNPWLTLLEQRGFPAKRPIELDLNLAGQLTAVGEAPTPTAMLVPLLDQGVIRASGAEADSFLQNLLTNNIKDIAPGESRLAGFCTPKGRLLALFRVWQDVAIPGDLLLMLPRELLPAMLRKLSMYVLRSKVKLTDATDSIALIGLATRQGAVPAGLTFAGTKIVGLTTTTLPSLSLVAAPAETMAANADAVFASGQFASLATWHWLEIAAGLPRITTATQESFVPQMLNMELRAVGGISFSKGCYPGQEIVARTQYLGKIKRRMVRASIPDETSVAAAGTPIFTAETADQQCGTVVAVAMSPSGQREALVCLQIGAVEASDVRLGAPAGPKLTVLPLPYVLDGPDTRGT